MTNKKIIAIIGGVCAACIVTTIAIRIIPTTDSSGWKHYADTGDIKESKEKDENDERNYALVKITKSDWENISAHNFIESVTSILNSYSDKDYTTFMFEDGTGLMFPGSDKSETAFYGKVDEDGNVTTTEKYVTIRGSVVNSADAESYISEDSTSLYSVIPDEYKNDSTYVNVADNTAYIRVTVSDNVATLDAANKIYENLKKSEKQYESVHIQVNDDAFEQQGDAIVPIEDENATNFIK